MRNLLFFTVLFGLAGCVGQTVGTHNAIPTVSMGEDYTRTIDKENGVICYQLKFAPSPSCVFVLGVKDPK